ncbi:MAG: glycosyltransferase, partial [Candidatus Ratteibacteria bacterium]
MKTVIHYTAGTYLPITENWIYGQIKNLKRYQPVVYALQTENLDIYPTERIRSLELNPELRNLYTFFNKGWNKLFNFYPRFLFNLRQDKPALVHAHFGPSGYGFLPLKNLFKLPMVTTFYGYDLSLVPSQHPEWREKYKKLFKEGEVFLVEGNYMRKRLIELDCPEGKIIVQHLGTDLDKIRFVPRTNEDAEVRILISASFKEKKGIPYAVKAFGQVKQSHPNLKLKLTIIGDSNGNPAGEEEKKKIFNVIHRYNLKECVNLLGYQPYPLFLRELYRHHIFLHPSIRAANGDTEGGVPISVIEASASGMPILSTTHCDIPEVVIDGQNGCLVPERDTDALAKKLEFLVLNPNLWQNMGLSG